MRNVHVGWGPVSIFNTVQHKELKLALNYSNVKLELDQQVKIEPTSDYTKPLTFKSSNSNVVKVTEDGTVTAVGYGTAIITVISGEYKGTCVIKIEKPQEVPEVPTSKLDNTKIYYGVIENPTFNSFPELTEDIVSQALEKGMLSTKTITAFENSITIKNAGDVTVILIPTSIYKGYIDDGSGSTKIPFKEIATGTNFYSNGEVKLGDFYIYGEWELTPGTTKIYVE